MSICAVPSISTTITTVSAKRKPDAIWTETLKYGARRWNNICGRAKMNTSSEVREDSYIYKKTWSMTEHQNVLSGSTV